MRRPTCLAIGVFLVGGQMAAQSPTKESPIAKPLTRFVEEVWNHGEFSVIPQVIAPGAKFHYRTFTSSDAEAIAKSWWTAFADFHFNIEELLLDGDKVAARLTFTGTQKGNSGDNQVVDGN